MQFEKVSALVQDAKSKGGRILLGGTPTEGPGNFYPVTLIADVGPGIRLVDEEQFGPVLPIIRYTDVQQVLHMANDSDMGLGGSVWSRDITAAKSLALAMECGSVWINAHGVIDPVAPFGGIKQSGLGVEFAYDGLKEFTTIQTLHC
jgi:acyl-CoA reductase-like NAD-dependent aldehyde dehydrogenase